MSDSGYSQRELIKFNFSNIDLEKNGFFGSSPPSVFVGRVGYPDINVGVLSPVEHRKDAYLFDNPKEWVKMKISDYDILKLRAQLINSRFKNNIKRFNTKLLDLSQEIGMAYKPVDIEVELKSKPIKNLVLNNILSPLSNNANVKDIKITENPKIKTIVEKTVSDIDMKATEGINKLYQRGIDENFLTKILSVGLLGLKKNRKLVPTRWSITATDDIIGKNILNEVRYYNSIDNLMIYFSKFIGDNYMIIMFPGVWSFELYEMQVPFKPNPWSKSGKYYAYDYENYYGRKGYAEETAGGYYACRLGVLEKLKEMRKQASVLVLRFIDEEDRFPLGVWVCREATRLSLKDKPIAFEDRELLLKYINSFVKKRFKVDIDFILKQSKTINEIKTQRRIMDFI